MLRLNFTQLSKKNYMTKTATEEKPFDPINLNFTQAAAWYFDRTYLKDGLDITDVLNGKYKTDALSRVAGFIGLPNRLDKGIEEQSIANLAKNFIGYQSNVSLGRKVVNVVTMPITVALNLLNIPFRLMTNTAKVVTEFLPGLAMWGCEKAMANLVKFLKSKGPITPLKVLAVLGLVFATLGYIIANQAYMIGRAITSPINAVKDAWHQGCKKSKVLGFFVAAFSLITTFTFYAIFFPIAIKALGAAALHFATTHFPALADAIGKGLAVVGKVLTPLVNFFGKYVFNIKSIATLTAKSAPAAIGAAGLAGLAAPTIGAGLDNGLNAFQSWWHKTEPVGPAPIVPTHQVVGQVMGGPNPGNPSNSDPGNPPSSTAVDIDKSKYDPELENAVGSLTPGSDVYVDSFPNYNFKTGQFEYEKDKEKDTEKAKEGSLSRSPTVKKDSLSRSPTITQFKPASVNQGTAVQVPVQTQAQTQNSPKASPKQN